MVRFFQLLLTVTVCLFVSCGSPPKVQVPLAGMEFALIPGDSFQMGSNDGESREKPVHRVTISPFSMMTTEVTQKMWKDIMGSNPSAFKGDNLPVEQVSWNDIQDFIKKLNERDPGNGYRLPSEAEWEYSCRAGMATRFYSGNSDSDLDRVGWYSDNSSDKTHPVGQKQPNKYGLYDMHGNVWEWCADWYHDNYTGAPTNGTAWTSPSGEYRVLRGGSWCYRAWFCRFACRGETYSDSRYIYIGFRLVKS